MIIFLQVNKDMDTSGACKKNIQNIF